MSFVPCIYINRRTYFLAALLFLSPCIKVGIGADEFMGGYSRHRNAFNRGGENSVCMSAIYAMCAGTIIQVLLLLWLYQSRSCPRTGGL